MDIAGIMTTAPRTCRRAAYTGGSAPMPRHHTSCSVSICPRPSLARGWCRRHYKAWAKHGDPLHHPSTPLERFVSKVQFTDTCWLWTAHLNNRGYGTFWNGRDTEYAHRWSYKLFVGEIPAGLQLDHLCRTHNCVRPDHLEPVTNQENSLRGKKATAPTCHRGHLYTPENIYHRPDRKRSRMCRACIKIRTNKRTVWRRVHGRR